MLISGVQPFSLLDFPARTSCIVFTLGCNFRCGYCHNPEFVLPTCVARIRGACIPTKTFFSFLDSRRGLLDGVVITGGEPTLMPDLLPFMHEIRARGFSVKLDTNGSRPHVLEAALASSAVDYAAMDYKTSCAQYPSLVGPLGGAQFIMRSKELLMRSKMPYEFRTTLVRELHTEEVLVDMARELRGAARLFLQTFRPATTLDPAFAQYHPFSEEETVDIAERFRSDVKEVLVR